MTGSEHTTFELRDVGLSAGQARREDVRLVLAPYVQGGVDFIPEGGGKVPQASEIRYLPVQPTVDARLDVSAMDSGWTFRLRFDAGFSGPCSRCLVAASIEVSVDAHEVHDPDAEGEGSEELRSDHVLEQGPVLDMTAWAQECVALQFPTQVLCHADCRGLCGQCGANMNEDPDHHHERPLDSRWDALKALQSETDGEAG